MRSHWCWTETPIWRTSRPSTSPRLSFSGHHAAGISDRRDRFARALDRRSRHSGRHTRGAFRDWGGAIIVPVLYEVFRVLDVAEAVRMQACIGTSLAIIVRSEER